ncbi:MAG: DEAD/DEAH box helicase family protein [Prevotellaceae bacterium]|nr:DEAD/DEAH box helicase family protein [Prevotellaceae bacterium]
MTTTTTNEQAFESLIEKALVGTTREERGEAADVDAQQPAVGMFYWGKPKDMDPKLAIDRRRLWSFLHETQQQELDKYVGTQMEKEVEKCIDQDIKTFGIIHVLKKGISVQNLKLTLFFPRPTAADSDASKEKYAANQFSVTRQQTYSILTPGNEIDMVVFVNGLPLMTIELKNPWTHQTAAYDGQRQYKKDRSQRDTIFNFGRCLAHFTMDKDEVFFTSKLCGEKTYFMPFNKGLPDGQGKGNPVNPNGHKTSYMWQKVLTRDNIADIISNYTMMDYGEKKTKKKVPHIMKNAKKLVFPRYHQLDAVTRLTADVECCGVGKRYLIMHSAGSGKSYSLTWLAYKLIKACPQSMDAKRAKAIDKQLFDSVIVVVDRKNLDDQITFDIRAFAENQQTIAHADTSGDLKDAIEQGKRIIITTIQKFPFICDTIANVSDHNFAVIIDEAHSSQSGIAHDKMNATMQQNNDDDEGDTDELIERLMKSRKMSDNCSYFAFTATPKKETLERFGQKDEEGQFHPFHLYSMKQAIEEGFILNVVANYTTYKGYYELVKSIRENPEYNNEKAQKLLRRVVERDPRTIEAKAGLMIEHFDAKVYRSHKLKSKAKAMVVTRDIECAIRYYQALQKFRREMRLPYNILIAFSGTKTVDGVEYTEAAMNGFPDSKTAENFDADENRILVVANKYLTGFDQPKLTAMYIDKPLNGVIAVQTLSRLNRSAQELSKVSEDLFVLDFYNTTDDMREAFNDYFTGIELSGETDVSILNTLLTTLLSMEVFTEEEIDEFAELYFHGAQQDQLSPILDRAVHRYDHETAWEENGQADFKMKCKQFVRVYSRMAAIMTFEKAEWEKAFWYLRLLIPMLRVPKQEDTLKDLEDSVDMSTYGLRRTALNERIELDSEETTIDPSAAAMAGASSEDQSRDPLDEILKEFNENFKGFEGSPDEQKAILLNITKKVHDDAQYQELIVGNPNTEAAREFQNKIIDRVMRQTRKNQESIYRGYQSNKEMFYNMIGNMLGSFDFLNT